VNRTLIAQILRFLLLGGLAAAINWLVRFPLSLVLPFSAAILVAYAIGMTAGFALYRAYVFPGSTVPIGRQVAVFLIVNAAGAVVVWSVAMLLVARVFPAADYAFMPEATAHGIAIAVGAAVNFVGHKFLTFRHAAGRHAASADIPA
jgi:energy-coupling factor transport system substrate-specific component